jgi:hypothetical protein
VRGRNGILEWVSMDFANCDGRETATGPVSRALHVTVDGQVIPWKMIRYGPNLQKMALIPTRRYVQSPCRRAGSRKLLEAGTCMDCRLDSELYNASAGAARTSLHSPAQTAAEQGRHHQ